MIYATWPNVIASDSLNNMSGIQVLGLRHNYTDAEVETLRRAAVNTLTQRPDGTVHVGPGGGVATSVKSGKVALEVAKIKGRCNEVERELTQMLALMIASGQLLPPIVLKLEQRATGTFAAIFCASPSSN